MDKKWSKLRGSNIWGWRVSDTSLTFSQERRWTPSRRHSIASDCRGNCGVLMSGRRFALLNHTKDHLLWQTDSFSNVIQSHVTKQILSPTGPRVGDQWTSVTSSVSKSVSSRRCGGAADWQLQCEADKTAETMRGSHINMKQNLRGAFPTSRGNPGHEIRGKECF